MSSEAKPTTPPRKQRLLKSQVKEFKEWLAVGDNMNAKAADIQAKFKEEHNVNLTLNFIREQKRALNKTAAENK